MQPPSLMQVGNNDFFHRGGKKKKKQKKPRKASNFTRGIVAAGHSRNVIFTTYCKNAKDQQRKGQSEKLSLINDIDLYSRCFIRRKGTVSFFFFLNPTHPFCKAPLKNTSGWSQPSSTAARCLCRPPKKRDTGSDSEQRAAAKEISSEAAAEAV